MSIQVLARMRAIQGNLILGGPRILEGEPWEYLVGFNIDEFGNRLLKGLVYTGTMADGSIWNDNTCNDWNGLDEGNAAKFMGGYGSILGWEPTWTQANTTTCDEAFSRGAHLYCFEI